jgi:hypothetical protein
MQYPIVLTGDSRSIYACEWNGDTYEIHTLESLQKEYGETNLFDDEPSWYSTAAEQNLTFLEVLEELEAGQFNTITNDNMTITILKRAGV